MMGIAPAPHLGGLTGSAGTNARAEAEARKRRVQERLASSGLPAAAGPTPSAPAPARARPSAPPIGGSQAPRPASVPPPAQTNVGSPGNDAKTEVAKTGTALLEPLSTDWSAPVVAQGTTTVIMVDNYPSARSPSGSPPPRESAPAPPVTAPTPDIPLELPNNNVASVTAEPAAGATPAEGSTEENPPNTQPFPARGNATPLARVSLPPTGLVPRMQPGALRSIANAEPPLGMASPAQVDYFRELRTRLLEMGAALKLRYFTTLVVPLKSGSGGSFVARNLATAFTMEGQGNALLIDCDLHRPSQHVAFHVKSETGLFTFLEEPHGNFEQLAHPTAVPGLGLITAGRARYREYFSSPPMRALMDAVRRAECFTFLDGPAVQGSPDARILSDLVDFVILVVGYGMGTPDEIAEAAATFDRTKFAGVVFNERA
jgi:Mrp family chromosome partitioning ATPase